MCKVPTVSASNMPVSPAQTITKVATASVVVAVVSLYSLFNSVFNPTELPHTPEVEHARGTDVPAGLNGRPAEGREEQMKLEELEAKQEAAAVRNEAERKQREEKEMRKRQEQLEQQKHEEELRKQKQEEEAQRKREQQELRKKEEEEEEKLRKQEEDKRLQQLKEEERMKQQRTEQLRKQQEAEQLRQEQRLRENQRKLDGETDGSEVQRGPILSSEQGMHELYKLYV